jgi:O-antigen ligase
MSTLEIASAERPISDLRLRLAEASWRMGMAALAVMPVGMTVAHRSSPFFLALSALFALAAVMAEGRLRRFLGEATSALTSPLGLAALAFLGWTFVSVSWSEFPGTSLRALGEVWFPVASAFIVGIALPKRMTRLAFWLLAGSFAIACILIMVELRTDLALRRALGMRWNTYIFNRPILTLLVLTPPLVAWLLGHARRGFAYGLALVALLASAALHSDSGAGDLGLIVAGLAFLFAWFAPRLFGGGMVVAFAIIMISAPFIGSISDRLIPATIHERLAEDHSRERVDIWVSFGAAVRERPVLGSGFGVSPRMGETAVAREVSAEQRRMLAVGHPHNTPLQIWAELGAVGALMVFVIAALVLRAIRRQPHMIRSASLASLAAATAVALVGHGAWQGWWVASLGAAVTWMLSLRESRLEKMS